MAVTRRQLLGAALAGSASLMVWPSLALAASQASPQRLVVVLLRGAVDGLSAVPAPGEKRFAELRGSLDLRVSGGEDAPLEMADGFALHPSLGFAHGLFRQRQFAVVHACALPYRGRSHFDAQDCLENGSDKPHGSRSGWLNRVVERWHQGQGLAIASAQPLLVRGPAPFMTWSPTPGKLSPANLAQRLADSYGRDKRLSGAFEQALEAQNVAPEKQGGAGNLVAMMKAAGNFLVEPDGPRVAMVQDTGWDTHANQNAVLARKLRLLDNGLKALRDSLGKQWNHTVVLVATEFGRTVAVNGTRGTDHGTGSTVMLAGGGLKSAGVVGDWPGLNKLRDDRDLMPANDTRAVFKGVLRDHLGLDKKALDNDLFPGSARVAGLSGLV